MDIYKSQGFGNSVGLSASSGLLVIDFTIGFIDPAWFGGGNISEAAARTEYLLAEYRALGLPIAHSRIVYPEDARFQTVFARKAPRLRLLTESNPASHFIPSLQPLPGECVITKTEPSAFFQTPLAAWLKEWGVDSLLVAGCTTSGCVRASVVDAKSFGFDTTVISDCVGDRAPGPHEANLYDIEQKYGDVRSAESVLRELASLKAGAK